MFKSIAVIAIVATSALAATSASAQIQDCGPRLTFNASETSSNTNGTGGFNGASTNKTGGTNFGISLSFTIGKKKVCDRYNSAIIHDKEVRLRHEDAKAIKDKLAICGDFTNETAPNSIRAFCGDLLGVKVKVNPAQSPVFY